MNTELLRLFLDGGEEKMASFYLECEALPPRKPRKEVTDAELLKIVKSMAPIKNIQKAIKHIRHNLGKKAKEERIKDAIKEVRRGKG